MVFLFISLYFLVISMYGFLILLWTILSRTSSLQIATEKKQNGDLLMTWRVPKPGQDLKIISMLLVDDL